MTNYTMEVIPKPKEGTATVFQYAKKGEHIFIKGSGEDNYLCGTCGSIICKDVDRGQVRNIVFKCPNCNSYNFLKGT